MPLKVSDGIGAWIKDFKKSDAPQFKGKDADERRDMAIAAYLSAKRGGKPQNEGVDEKIVGYKKDSKLPNLRVPIRRKQGTILPKKEENQPEEGTPEATKKAKSMTPGYTAESLKIYEAQFISPKMYKVKQLARLGLVNKQDVQKLLNAMDTMNQGKELPKKQRDIIFGAFGDLIDLVTGDKMIFQKAKKAVKEETIIDEAIKYTHAAIDRFGKVIGMASKESDAKDMARRHKGKVVKLKKPMAPRTGDMMINRPLKEADDKDPGEYDEEGAMMKDQLDIIMDAADEIYDMVDDDENLPEWVQNKITKAADYIDSARDYLMSQKKDNSDD